MAVGLRILLLVAAIVTACWILLKIRKLKVKMEDAIFWVCFAAILLIMGIFPGVTYWLTGVLHMISPANLIFLIIIALLIEKVFTLSIITSQLEEKVTILSAEVALRSHADSKQIKDEEKEIEELNAEETGADKTEK